MPKSDKQLISDLNNLDHGVCNPIKAKMAGEKETDIRAELRSRGYSDSEINAELD